MVHACHGHRYRPSQVPLSRTEQKKEGGGSNGGPPALAGTREYEQSQPESVAGRRWFEVLWNLKCPIGLSQKRNMCAYR